MSVEPLFTLFGAPDLDALLHEPLNYEGRFILTAAQPVKHKNEQHIELMLCCSSLDFNDSVSCVCADLVARHSLF